MYPWDEAAVLEERSRIPPIFPEGLGRTRPPRGRKEADWVAEVAHALHGPIIVYGPEAHGWGEALPEWIRRDMGLERILKLMKDPEPGLASDLEALAYLYPATLAHPLPYPWANIYLWLAAKELRKRGRLPPDVPAPERLSEDEAREYRMFKAWLHGKYRKGIRHRPY